MRRLLIVCVTICAWAVVSNHCALVALGATHGISECCPMHSKPAKESNLVCCKVLRASIAKEQVQLSPPVKILDGAFVSHGLVAMNEREKAAPLFLACVLRPPRADCFAVAVMQRSMRAHAPPSLG